MDQTIPLIEINEDQFQLCMNQMFDEDQPEILDSPK